MAYGSRSLAKDFSLRFFIIIGILSIFVFSTSSYILLSIQEKKFEQESRQIFQGFKKIIAAPLWDYENEYIDLICNTFLSSRLVSGIHIYSNNNKIMHSYGHASNDSPGSKSLSDDIYSHGEKVGKIIILFKKTGYIENNIYYFATTILAIMLISVFISLATWQLIHIYVKNPLEKLLARFDQIAKGDYKIVENISFPQKELQDVVRHFSVMVESIRNREQQIIENEEKHRVHLEKTVMERTAELKLEIVERKKAERKLLKANKTAEDARQAAEKANKAKSIFLANMSHELRTPLNAILGYTQILNRDNITQEQLKAVNTIHRSGEHLLLLINDILDISKIEARKTELCPKTFLLTDFLHDIVDLIKVCAGQLQVKFSYSFPGDLPLLVKGDEKRMRQILLNLLGNAVKFADCGNVEFRVKQLDKDQFNKGDKEFATLCFEVIDTGIGIPEDQLEEIFKPFHQVREQRMVAEGTGLGLAISRELIRMMGGELQVESKEGQGSTFRFEVILPLAKDFFDCRLENDSKLIVGFKGEKRKILIAGDNADNLKLVFDMLSPLGFEVREAAPKSCNQTLIIPPEEDLTSLENAAGMGFISDIKNWINMIKNKDKKYALFAEIIERFADKYEFEEILSFIEHHLQEGKQ